MAAEQRFCPICDEAFLDGDAVLRCSGCGVFYHPRCWVREDGCTAPGDHDRTPMALAYPPVTTSFGSSLRTEGASRSAPRPRMPEGRPLVHSEVVIGEEPSEAPAHQREAEEVPPRPRLPSVPYVPRRNARRTMPSNLWVYERRRWARYWYVPVAAAVAAIVAFAVIVVGERLLGGDSGAPVIQDTPKAEVPTVTSHSSPTVQSDAPTSLPTNPAATGTVPGRFAPRQRLKVTGTGECLNVRVQPGLQSDVVACIADGTEVEVLGGPREADGYRWWQLTTPQGDGWAVENYLAPSP